MSEKMNSEVMSECKFLIVKKVVGGCDEKKLEALYKKDRTITEHILDHKLNIIEDGIKPHRFDNPDMRRINLHGDLEKCLYGYKIILDDDINPKLIYDITVTKLYGRLGSVDISIENVIFTTVNDITSTMAQDAELLNMVKKDLVLTSESGEYLIVIKECEDTQRNETCKSLRIYRKGAYEYIKHCIEIEDFMIHIQYNSIVCKDFNNSMEVCNYE